MSSYLIRNSSLISSTLSFTVSEKNSNFHSNHIPGSPYEGHIYTFLDMD